jgi:hypothetical protein
LRSEGKIARTLGLKSQASSVKHQASSIKHQASSIKHQTSTKDGMTKTTNINGFEHSIIGYLEFVWSLMLGHWCFEKLMSVK